MDANMKKEDTINLCVKYIKDVMIKNLFEPYEQKTFLKMEMEIAKNIVKNVNDINFKINVNGNENCNNIFVELLLFDYNTKIKAYYDDETSLLNETEQEKDIKISNFENAMKIVEKG